MPRVGMAISRAGQPATRSPTTATGYTICICSMPTQAVGPHSVVLTKPVTLDRLVPVVYITSPASDAVLDQAFHYLTSRRG